MFSLNVQIVKRAPYWTKCFICLLKYIEKLCLGVFWGKYTNFRNDIVDIIDVLLLDMYEYLYPRETPEMFIAKSDETGYVIRCEMYI